MDEDKASEISSKQRYDKLSKRVDSFERYKWVIWLNLFLSITLFIISLIFDLYFIKYKNVITLVWLFTAIGTLIIIIRYEQDKRTLMLFDKTEEKINKK